jgi:hypothetical protein|tara:strand:- start:153 stop:272 length:120 start_codon:yes stop_codon:yes gene_type:complete
VPVTRAADDVVVVVKGQRFHPQKSHDFAQEQQNVRRAIA